MGSLTIKKSVIISNTAQYGGGILNWKGTLNLINTIIQKNTANSYGGGIENQGTSYGDSFSKSQLFNNSPNDINGSPLIDIIN